MPDPVKPAATPPKPAAPVAAKPAAPAAAKPAAPAPAAPAKGKKLKVHGFKHHNVRNPDGTVSPTNLRAMMGKVIDQVEAGHYAYQNEKETPLADGRVGTHVEFDYVEVNPATPGADA